MHRLHKCISNAFSNQCKVPFLSEMARALIDSDQMCAVETVKQIITYGRRTRASDECANGDDALQAKETLRILPIKKSRFGLCLSATRACYKYTLTISNCSETTC